MLSTVALYNGIYKTLRSDPAILYLLGLIPVGYIGSQGYLGSTGYVGSQGWVNYQGYIGSVGYMGSVTPSQFGPKIQKQSKPQLLASNLPIIAFYTPGGRLDLENQLVHKPVFYFDIYTKDVNLAHQIAERIFELFDDKFNDFTGVANTVTEFIDAHESACDMQDTYCFTLEILFSIAIQ